MLVARIDLLFASVDEFDIDSDLIVGRLHEGNWGIDIQEGAVEYGVPMLQKEVGSLSIHWFYW